MVNQLEQEVSQLINSQPCKKLQLNQLFKQWTKEDEEEEEREEEKSS